MSKRSLEIRADDPEPQAAAVVQLVYTPFCVADQLADGASFRPNERRIGMLDADKVASCCWTCLKAEAPVLCSACNTGRYCSEDCRAVDSLFHAQFCKADGHFYWPPPPKCAPPS